MSFLEKYIKKILPEKGSFLVSQENKIIRNQEIDKKKFAKNEFDFYKSKERKSALQDFDMMLYKELGLEDILTDDELINALYDPDSYKDKILHSLEKDNQEEVAIDLNHSILALQVLLPQLEQLKESTLNTYLDYKPDKENQIDFDFQEQYKKRYLYVEDLLDTGKEILKFLETKKQEFLL